MCRLSIEARRTILWMCWIVNMLITSIYYILSFLTTSNLIRSFRTLNISLGNRIWHAPLAASLLGGLLVLLFNALSCGVLLRKTVKKRGAGMAYGFVTAMCFCLSFFCLVCGLVLDGFRDVVINELQGKLGATGEWTKYNTGEFTGTIAFAFLCFIMFALFFVALVVFRTEMSEELNADMEAPASPEPRPPALQMSGLPFGLPSPYAGGDKFMPRPGGYQAAPAPSAPLQMPSGAYNLARQPSAM